MTLKDEWNMVEAINVKLLADLRAYEHTETLMQHQINGLESELAAANDSIERSKDYECELRAEVERLTGENNFIKRQREGFIDTNVELRAEVERLRKNEYSYQPHELRLAVAVETKELSARITELEGVLEAALTQLDGACRRAGDDTDTIHIETQQARAALSQEKK
jgi:septal ring factor EnvC (AmiA/AmiB activator)